MARYLDFELERDFPEESAEFKSGASYYVCGPTGTGKTALICAMMKERSLAKAGYAKDCLFVTAEDMVDRIRDSFNRPDGTSFEDSLVTRYKTVQILAIDDLGADKPSEWTVSKISQIINYRYGMMLPTYISSNVEPGKLAENLSERIASRLAHMCEIIILEKNRRIRNGG